MEKKILIVGGGPAGLTAGIYGLRSGLKPVIVEQSFFGGTINLTDRVENYPGFPEGIEGNLLAHAMEQQYKNLGGSFISGKVTAVIPGERLHTLVLSTGEKLNAAVVILATGTSRKKLGVAGEERLTGRGVSYCALCDGAFFRNKKVAVVGGGDSALRESLYLSRMVSHCFLIHRRENFRGQVFLQEEVRKNEKITCLLSTVVESIEGEKQVEEIILRHLPSGKIEKLPVAGVFISVGQKPNTEFLGQVLQLNSSGHIITDETMATSQPGIFACGDVREKHLYQIITACSDGAIAAYFAERYLSQLKNSSQV